MKKQPLLTLLFATASSIALLSPASAQTSPLSGAFKPSVEMHLEVLSDLTGARPIPTPMPADTQPSVQVNAPTPIAQAEAPPSMPTANAAMTTSTIQPLAAPQPTETNRYLPPSRYQNAQDDLPRHSSRAWLSSGRDLPRGADGRIVPPAPPGAPVAQSSSSGGWMSGASSYVGNLFNGEDETPQPPANPKPVSTKPIAVASPPPPPPAPEAKSALPPLPEISSNNAALPSLMASQPPAKAMAAPTAPTLMAEAPPAPPPPAPTPMAQDEEVAPPPMAMTEQAPEPLPALKPAQEEPAVKKNIAAYDGLELAEGLGQGASAMDQFAAGYATPEPTPEPAPMAPGEDAQIALPAPKMAEGEQLLAHAGDDTPPNSGLKDPFADGSVQYQTAPSPLSDVPNPPEQTSSPNNAPLTAPPAMAMANAAPEQAPTKAPPMQEPTPMVAATASKPTPAPEQESSWMDSLKKKVTGYFSDEEEHPTIAPTIEQPALKMDEMQTPPPATLANGVSPKEATPPGLPSLTKLTGDPEVMQQTMDQQVTSSDVPTAPLAPAESQVLAKEEAVKSAAEPEAKTLQVVQLEPEKPAVKPLAKAEVKKAEPKNAEIKKRKVEAKKAAEPEPKIEPKAEAKIEAKAEPKTAPERPPVAAAEEKPAPQKLDVSIQPAAKPEPADAQAQTAILNNEKGKEVVLKREDEATIETKPEESKTMASASPADVPSAANSGPSLSLDFAPHSKDLPADAKEKLKPIAAALKASPSARVFLKATASEADENSARPYALARMIKVRVALIQLGVDEMRINVVTSASSKSDTDRVSVNVKETAGS